MQQPGAILAGDADTAAHRKIDYSRAVQQAL
jgi:hypothetical protein